MARGLAGVKFSGSPRELGENRARAASRMNSSTNPRMSFVE